MDVAKAEETGFTHVAQGGDAAGDLHLFAFLEVRKKLCRSGRNLETRAVRIDAEFAEFRELLSAYGDQFGFGILRLLRCDGFTHVGDGLRGRREDSQELKQKLADNSQHVKINFTDGPDNHAFDFRRKSTFLSDIRHIYTVIDPVSTRRNGELFKKS